jgi:ABC-type nitrate/sulfonate/bicarbonate transport system permease component
VLLGLVVWQVTVDESFMFPPPSEWFAALGRLHEAGRLVPAATTTLYTFALSLVIATVLGAGLGLLIGSSRRLERALTPLMDFFRSLPPPAVVPLMAILLGITLQASLAVIVLAIIWPILLNTITAVRSIPAVRHEMARSLGLSTFERVFRVLLPSTIAGIFVGVKVAVSISLVVTLLVDILGHAEGIGRLLVERQQYYDSPAVWGLLLTVGIFGYLLNVILALMENVVLRNRPS